METIKNYLDNMFSTLPKSEEIQNLKLDLLYNMEDKYNELKNEGKTENEAIGIVISEFGNIDELINSLGINVPSTINSEIHATHIIEIEEANNYLDTIKHTSFLTGIGVSLCIIGASILILLFQLMEDGIIFKTLSKHISSFAIVMPLIVLVAIAVGLFIYSSSKTEKYKFIDKYGDYTTSYSAKQILNEKYEIHKPKATLATILGVCLCILSPFCIFIGSIIYGEESAYGVVFLLLLITAAVFIFINFGSYENAYKKLLQIEDYSINKRKTNKAIGAIAGFFWPCIAAIYLFISFIFNSWHISWIIFPIAGILFGGFCALYTNLKNESKI